MHRSAYQLKEADAHTWVIPRLRGAAKAAAVSIQYDEYGAGETAAMHAELFAVTMEGLGLDASFGAYVDLLPGTTLATDNLTSLFGLHRRWRGACVGHLALFEMTSIVPMGRYAQALTRVGAPAAAREFYDVHVQADARPRAHRPRRHGRGTGAAVTGARGRRALRRTRPHRGRAAIRSAHPRRLGARRHLLASTAHRPPTRS